MRLFHVAGAGPLLPTAVLLGWVGEGAVVACCSCSTGCVPNSLHLPQLHSGALLAGAGVAAALAAAAAGRWDNGHPGTAGGPMAHETSEACMTCLQLLLHPAVVLNSHRFLPPIPALLQTC